MESHKAQPYPQPSSHFLPQISQNHFTSAKDIVRGRSPLNSMQSNAVELRSARKVRRKDSRSPIGKFELLLAYENFRKFTKLFYISLDKGKQYKKEDEATLASYLAITAKTPRIELATFLPLGDIA